MHLAQYFVQAVKRFPEATAVVDDQVRWSYRDLYEEVSTVAANVQQSGVQQGDHVLVVLKNHRENLVIYWACQLLGLIYTPVNFRMSLAELVYCIGDAEPVLVFFEGDNRATIEAALKQAQSSARVCAVGASAGLDTLEQLRWRGAALQAVPTLSDDAIAIMLYTSGTTGRPKGVPRSHLNEVSAAEAHIMQNQYTLFESTIGAMPFYHTMGMRTLLVTAFLNGKLVLLPNYEPQAALELLAQEEISSLYLVPTLYYDLVSRPQLDQYDLRALTKIGYAGAAMTSTLTQACFERLRPKVFVNHFGSSEVYTFSSPEAFKGYWHRPDANEKALRQGWYFTGDVGVWDEDGDLWVQGRVDDMLISGGENIHPLEVEDVLAQHPRVAEVAVAGLPDERWGQIVAAFVVPADTSLTAEELDQFALANPQLARFKRPRRYVFIKEVPKSAVGKILRRKLQAGEYEVYDMLVQQ